MTHPPISANPTYDQKDYQDHQEVDYQQADHQQVNHQASRSDPIPNNGSVQLDRYRLPDHYSPGAPLWQQLLWYYIGLPLVKSVFLPFSSLKLWILRQFGATVGQGVRIKPGVHIKFPWRLTIGNHCWIGEQVWIDNLAPVSLEDHVCLSQGVYLCTGNHDWSQPTFDLRVGPIHLASGCWIGAKSIVGPGVTVGPGAILSLGSVASTGLDPMTIYAGHPAQPIKPRVIKASSSNGLSQVNPPKS